MKRHIVPFFYGNSLVFKNYRDEGYSTRYSWYHNYYLKTEHWKKLHNKILKTNNEKCFFCKTNKSEHIHHRHYRTLGAEKLGFDVVPLCESCHFKEHYGKVSHYKQYLDHWINWKKVKICRKMFIKYTEYKTDLARTRAIEKLDVILKSNYIFMELYNHFKKNNYTMEYNELVKLSYKCLLYCLKLFCDGYANKLCIYDDKDFIFFINKCIKDFAMKILKKVK